MRIFSLLFVLIPSVAGSQNSFYVSPGGDNANSGSLVSPWLTIQYALDAVSSGDIIEVLAGTYNEKLEWSVTGTAAFPTTLRAYNGANVIVSGAGITSQDAVLLIENKSHVLVDGIRFTDNFQQDAQGILVTGQGQNITIAGCEIDHIGFTSDPNADPYGVSPSGQAHGILVNGRTITGLSDIHINGCTLHDLITGNSEALTLVGNTYDFLIENNMLYDNTNIGIDIAGHWTWAVDPGVPASLNQARDGSVVANTVYNHRRFSNVDAPPGLYADGSKNVLFEHNISHDNGVGISVGCENAGKTAENIIVRNNLVYNNDNDGIVFGANNGNINACAVRNNTCLKNGALVNFNAEIALQNNSNCIVANNILYARSDLHYAIAIWAYTATAITISNNVMYRESGNTSGLIDVGGGSSLPAATNSVYADPLFMSAALPSPDLHILPASPAISAGNNAYAVSGEVDIDGQMRIIGAAIDCGADEQEAVMPVELARALQADVRGGSVELRWSVLTERNIRGYRIERGDDMVRWEAFQLVAPGLRHYTTIDRQPLDGVNYYRLVALENDGDVRYLSVASAQFDARNAFALIRYRPSEKQIYFQFNTEETCQIEVFDANGARVFHTLTDRPEYVVSSASWRSGAYVAVCTTRMHRVSKWILIP